MWLTEHVLSMKGLDRYIDRNAIVWHTRSLDIQKGSRSMVGMYKARMPVKRGVYFTALPDTITDLRCKFACDVGNFRMGETFTFHFSEVITFNDATDIGRYRAHMDLRFSEPTQTFVFTLFFVFFNPPGPLMDDAAPPPPLSHGVVNPR